MPNALLHNIYTRLSPILLPLFTEVKKLAIEDSTASDSKAFHRTHNLTLVSDMRLSDRLDSLCNVPFGVEPNAILKVENYIFKTEKKHVGKPVGWVTKAAPELAMSSG